MCRRSALQGCDRLREGREQAPLICHAFPLWFSSSHWILFSSISPPERFVLSAAVECAVEQLIVKTLHHWLVFSFFTLFTPNPLTVWAKTTKEGGFVPTKQGVNLVRYHSKSLCRAEKTPLASKLLSGRKCGPSTQNNQPRWKISCKCSRTCVSTPPSPQENKHQD